MNKIQVLDQFWNSFGWDAYDDSSVPQGASLPYITYSVSSGGFSDQSIQLSASLWVKSTSWVDITAKVATISEYIGYSGVVLPCDGGYLWIKRGSTFAQRMSDPDSTIRRVVLTIEVDYLSKD